MCQSRSCWEELGLQEQLGVCDTEMSLANFRGTESKRKDILLELSMDFLAGSCRSPGSLLSHRTPPGSSAYGGALGQHFHPPEVMSSPPTLQAVRQLGFEVPLSSPSPQEGSACTGNILGGLEIPQDPPRGHRSKKKPGVLWKFFRHGLDRERS